MKRSVENSPRLAHLGAATRSQRDMSRPPLTGMMGARDVGGVFVDQKGDDSGQFFGTALLEDLRSDRLTNGLEDAATISVLAIQPLTLTGAPGLLSERRVPTGDVSPRPEGAIIPREHRRAVRSLREVSGPPSRGTRQERRTVAGTVAVPTDTYNGMTSILLKNLAKGASPSTHLLAFTPKPSVPELHSAPEGTDVYSVGRADSSATRFVMKPEVTGLRSVVATVAGKQPKPFRMWIADGKAPAVVYFEGPMWADGPIWRIGLSAPRLDLKAR